MCFRLYWCLSLHPLLLLWCLLLSPLLSLLLPPVLLSLMFSCLWHDCSSVFYSSSETKPHVLPSVYDILQSRCRNFFSTSKLRSLLLLVCTDSFFSSCQYGIGCVGSGGGGQISVTASLFSFLPPFLECFKAVVSPTPISSYESLSLVGKVDFSLGVSPGSFGSNLSGHEKVELWMVREGL